MHRRSLVRHEESRGGHLRDIEVLIHRVEVDVLRLGKQGERAHELRRVEHAPRRAERLDLEPCHLVHERLDGIAIRHGEIRHLRVADALHHLREELHLELRITAEAELLAEAHDSRGVRIRLLRELARRHPGEQPEILEQEISEDALRR